MLHPWNTTPQLLLPNWLTGQPRMVVVMRWWPWEARVMMHGVGVMTWSPSSTAAPPTIALHVGQSREGDWRVQLRQPHGKSHGRLRARRNNGQHAGHRVPGIRWWYALLLGILDLLEKGGIELVQMLWHQVGVHLDVGEALGVALEVDLQVALGCEAIAADVALVGPLTSVGSEIK